MIDLTKMVTKAMKEENAANAAREAKNAEARLYLAATDWLLLRQIETGKAIPSTVATARQAARLAITGIPPI